MDAYEKHIRVNTNYGAIVTTQMKQDLQSIYTYSFWAKFMNSLIRLSCYWKAISIKSASCTCTTTRQYPSYGGWSLELHQAVTLISVQHSIRGYTCACIRIVVGKVSHTDANVSVCLKSGSGTVLQQVLTVPEIPFENSIVLHGNFTCTLRTFLSFQAYIQQTVFEEETTIDAKNVIPASWAWKAPVDQHRLHCCPCQRTI